MDNADDNDDDDDDDDDNNNNNNTIFFFSHALLAYNPFYIILNILENYAHNARYLFLARLQCL